MDAQISLLRRQLRHPRTKLADIDKVLADLEATIPKRSGRWTNRTREAAIITYQLCRNDCVEAMSELDEVCNAIDAAIEKWK